MTTVKKKCKCSIDLIGLNEYLAKVKRLTGIKLKMANPIIRACYEQKSIDTGRWLTLDEFEKLL